MTEQRDAMGTVKRDKPKLDREDLIRLMQLWAAQLRQSNKTEADLTIANLLEEGVECIEADAEHIKKLQTRLHKRPA